MSDRNRAGERSGVAAGLGWVGAVAEGPPLDARLGLGGWILESADREFFPQRFFKPNGPNKQQPLSL